MLKKHLTAKLEITAKEYLLDKNIIFPGFHIDIAAYLDIADLFVHVPSLPEPFGRTVLEAMQMGKPVITSNVVAADHLKLS